MTPDHEEIIGSLLGHNPNLSPEEARRMFRDWPGPAAEPSARDRGDDSDGDDDDSQYGDFHDARCPHCDGDADCDCMAEHDDDASGF